MSDAWIMAGGLVVNGLLVFIAILVASTNRTPISNLRAEVHKMHIDILIRLQNIGARVGWLSGQASCEPDDYDVK